MKWGLMYVDIWVNQKPTKSTMVDFSVAHNFIMEVEARRLNLHWKNNTEKMKIVNSMALSVVGLVKQMVIKLEEWRSPLDFMVVMMDDFDIVLGMKFFLEHQVILVPLAKYL